MTRWSLLFELVFELLPFLGVHTSPLFDLHKTQCVLESAGVNGCTCFWNCVWLRSRGIVREGKQHVQHTALAACSSACAVASCSSRLVRSLRSRSRSAVSVRFCSRLSVICWRCCSIVAVVVFSAADSSVTRACKTCCSLVMSATISRSARSAAILC